MTPLFIAGIWLATAALCSLLIGGGLRLSTLRATRVRAPRRASDFKALPLDVWTAAANADAIEALLGTRPGVVRRVPDPYSELDG